tara:strand:+ start:1727 stop:3208 length:1482 start_codon:yes stop_codon:yes gene_type:complete
MTHALKFHTELGIDPNITPFHPDEQLDVSEKWINETIRKSIPVYEGFKVIGGDKPFVVRNYSFDMFDPLNEYYDPIATSIINNRKLNKQHNVSTVMEDLYHIGSKQDANIPFIGKKNDIYVGYWDSQDKKWVTPMHEDIGDVFNIIQCDSGKKIIFMWDPSQKEKLHLKGIGSRTNIPYIFHNITNKKYNNVYQLERYAVILNAKDILYIPKNFVHTVYSWEKTFCKSHWIDKNNFETKYINKKFSFLKVDFYTQMKEKSETQICNNDSIENFPKEQTKNKQPLLWWFKYFPNIAAALWNNQIVEIPNAFENPSRFDLDKYEHWESQPSNNNVDFHRHVLKNAIETERFVEELNKYKNFFEDLVASHMLIDEKNFMATMYVEDDYLETHTDNVGNRILSFVYHNTKTWNENCGGELVFNGAFGQKTIIPSYNTLYLLIPSKNSHHRIKDVNCGKRFSISGWGLIRQKNLEVKLLETIRDTKQENMFKNHYKVI